MESLIKEHTNANGHILSSRTRYIPRTECRDIIMYQEMIGMLQWATELGRVDILHEISLLSQYQAYPREGQMEQLLHIFSYLNKKPKQYIYYGPLTTSLGPFSIQGCI